MNRSYNGSTSKKWILVLLGVFAVVFVVALVAFFVFFNSASSNEDYDKDFQALAQEYNDKIGLDKSTLLAKNAKEADVFFISEDELKTVKELLLKVEEEATQVPQDANKESLEAVKKIRRNVDFLSKIYSATYAQTELSRDELAGTCGNGNEVAELMDVVNEAQASAVDKYYSAFCIYFLNKDSVSIETQKANENKLIWAKAKVISTLERIDEVFDVSEETQDGGDYE